MEDAFVIYGGKPLKGTVQLSGAKNVALKMIIAALLFDQKVLLQNIPRIKDVIELLNLIQSLGGKAEFIDKNLLEIDGRTIQTNTIDLLYASKIRVSFMMFAPLLHLFKECYIPNPGGCRIGARPIDRVMDGLRALGVDVNYNSESGNYEGKMEKSPNGEYTFEKPSHTGTELLILMGVLGDGKVAIKNAALEPEIDNLIDFLNSSGGKVKREGTTIEINGVGSLSRTKPFIIVADRNEAITYASLAYCTKGDITVSDIPEEYIKSFLDKIKETGAGFEQKGNGIWRFYYNGTLKAVSVETLPHPGFMTDWQPNWAVLMTQAQGESVIHERVWEWRFAYVEELKKIGAKIDFIEIPIENPKEYYHFSYDENKKYKLAIKIHGPQHLHNGVMNISDLRAGATLAIAALMAEGESIITNASMLDRGYENFVEKVTALGGNIKRV